MLVDCVDSKSPTTKWVFWVDPQMMIEETQRSLLTQPPTDPNGNKFNCSSTPTSISLLCLGEEQRFTYLPENAEDMVVKLSELDGFYALWGTKSIFTTFDRHLVVILIPLNGNTLPTLPPDWIEFMYGLWNNKEVAQ